MHMHVRNLEESQKLIHCERATLCMSQVFETYQKFFIESVSLENPCLFQFVQACYVRAIVK